MMALNVPSDFIVLCSLLSMGGKNQNPLLRIFIKWHAVLNRISLPVT